MNLHETITTTTMSKLMISISTCIMYLIWKFAGALEKIGLVGLTQVAFNLVPMPT